MKLLIILLLFHLILLSPTSSPFINKKSKLHTLNASKNKQNISVKHYNNIKKKKRSLAGEDDGFRPIRIFVDKTFINTQKSEVNTLFDKVEASLEKCINVIKKLIRVKPIDKIKFTDNDIVKLGFNSNQIDPILHSANGGTSTDLVIVPRFITSGSTIALGKPEILDSATNRPIGAVLSINKDLPTKDNYENYLESIILHQLTHILGFTYGMFSNFPGGLDGVVRRETESRTHTNKAFIITPKVVEYAKKYFNCDSITGVELEEGEGDDGYTNSHWEARILLGEYMNSKVYTPEQAISGFTLALLEDSGWYKIDNYYTGGLMRFGKNQGCDFLYTDCEVLESSNNKFKNEFFTCQYFDNYRSVCTSGRQSRAYNVVYNKIKRQIQTSGKDIADYCFVSDFEPDEENIMFYVGSCNRGGGGYGTRIIYHTDDFNDNIFPNMFFNELYGERISSNSFCALSSIIPISSKIGTVEYNRYKNVIHPMCYPMFCSTQSLTIQIHNQYIVCPRSGGIVEINGDYEGHIFCPDYNLICTGSVMCNDMFECVENESIEKEESFIYEYETKTSQEYIQDNLLTESDISIGYELSDNGKCPEHCNQCKENKKCFICEADYLLIGTRENDENPIICSQTTDLSTYYKNDNDNTYYLCMDNCLSCASKDECNGCDLKYKLKEDKTCEEKILHCKNYDTNYEFCVECIEDYYLLNDDKSNCHNEVIDQEKHFTEDGGKTYLNCETVIDNCIKCENRNYCTLCKNGYLLMNENKECSIKIPHCKTFDSNYEYCEECDEGYYILNEDKTICHSKEDEPIDEEQYFTEDEGKKYINCGEAIENCLKCVGRNSCTQCINTHKLEQNGAICSPKIPNCKRFDANYEYCEECDDDYYLINNDNTHCHNNPINNEYFTEDDGKKYISCNEAIPNCLKCTDRNHCITCKEGYIIENDNSVCTLINDPSIQCKVNINNIDDKNINYLQEDSINQLIEEYIINYNNNNKGLVEHYINTIYNYSITIFKNSDCTKGLLSMGDYYINTIKILSLYQNGYFINCFISYQYKNMIYFYKDNGDKIDINNECPQCMDIKYNIKNNYTNELLNYYSPLLMEKIKEKSIDVLSEENEIINDNCNPLDYGGINIPINIRENIFYKNENMQGIYCTDPDCNIEIQKIEEFTADCECKIKNDLNVLLADINDDNGNDGNDNNNNNNESDNASNDKSANVFECLFKSENLLNNFAFYFTSSCTLIEVVSFILYTVFNQNINLQKYAPKKNNGNENEIEKEKEKNENNDFNSNLNEKNTNQIETPEKAINNNIPTEENIRPNSVLSSIEKFTSNPPPRHSIFYRYKWIKNKPKILSLENSHDEDLDIQSRDEADPENEIRRKIKNFSFFDKNSSVATSYLEDSLEDSMDKKTETSKNKITFINEDINKKTITEKVEEKKEIELTDVKIKKEFDIHENPLKRSEKLQTLKTNLPQVLTREENARKRKRVRSIKNIPQNKESTYPIKKKEEPKVIKLFDIYITVLCIKQHIINFFSCLFKIDINNNTCLHPESFIPLQMKINRFIFMIIVNIFFNTILLTQKYFIQKYNYFNDKYDLEKSADKNLIISAGEKISYAFGHCILNAIISFIICLIIQFIIGLIFFSTKKKIDNVIEIKEKNEQEKEYCITMKKIKCLFIIFSVINFVVNLIFSSYLISFNSIYDKSTADFLIPSFITFLLLQIFPFISSIVIALIAYFGFKKENKKNINIAKTLLF